MSKIRKLKCPYTGKVIYLRKYKNSGRVYLDLRPRKDEPKNFNGKWDDYEEPVFYEGGLLGWIGRKFASFRLG